MTAHGSYGFRSAKGKCGSSSSDAYANSDADARSDADIHSCSCGDAHCLAYISAVWIALRLWEPDKPAADRPSLVACPAAVICRYCLDCYWRRPSK